MKDYLLEYYTEEEVQEFVDDYQNGKPSDAYMLYVGDVLESGDSVYIVYITCFKEGLNEVADKKRQQEDLDAPHVFKDLESAKAYVSTFCHRYHTEPDDSYISTNRERNLRNGWQPGIILERARVDFIDDTPEIEPVETIDLINLEANYAPELKLSDRGAELIALFADKMDMFLNGVRLYYPSYKLNDDFILLADLNNDLVKNDPTDENLAFMSMASLYVQAVEIVEDIQENGEQRKDRVLGEDKLIKNKYVLNQLTEIVKYLTKQYYIENTQYKEILLDGLEG